jgi:hypothetical protein
MGKATDSATDKIPQQKTARTAARALGWFSVGLGVAQIMAPKSLGRAIGVKNTTLLRACGARELAAGVGLLTTKNHAPWLKGRVGGDLLDIAALLWQPDSAATRARRNAALAAVAAVTCVDVACAAAIGRPDKLSAGRFEHRDRSGFPQSPQAMRGSAVNNTEDGMNYDGAAEQRAAAVEEDSVALNADASIADTSGVDTSGVATSGVAQPSVDRSNVAGNSTFQP